MTPTPTKARPVPLAVWPRQTPATNSLSDFDRLAKTNPARTIDAGLFSRIVEEYSAKGSLVLDPVAGTGASLANCARSGRRCLGIEANALRVQLAMSRLDAELNTTQMRSVRLEVGRPDDLEALLANSFGKVDLIVLPPAITNNRRNSDAKNIALYRTCLGALRDGGILVAVASRDHGANGFVDVAGTTVDRAREAGFTYTQHIVSFLCEIDGDRPIEPASPKPAAGRTHHQAHQDVLVFSKGAARV